MRSASAQSNFHNINNSTNNNNNNNNNTTAHEESCAVIIRTCPFAIIPVEGSVPGLRERLCPQGRVFMQGAREGFPDSKSNLTL